jgi:hypothetical protein
MSEFKDIPPVTPYLTVSDARAAIQFYQRAFDARETMCGRPIGFKWLARN